MDENATNRTSSDPTTQKSRGQVSDSPGARWSEVESKRESEPLYAHLVVRRKVYDRLFASTSALHCDLLRFKLNLMLLGFADDRAAEILIRALRRQSDSGSDLRREVPHILAQFEVSQLARSDGPAHGDG